MKRLQRHLLLIILLVLPVAPLRAGDPDGAEFRERLESARMLYNSGAYAAAEQAFDELAASIGDTYALRRSELEAYRVLCAIAMDRVNAEWMVKVFALNYPTAPELSMVRYALASRFFDRGEYEKAHEYFEDINKRYLYGEWRTEFEFKRSFCDMRTGHNEKAAKGYESIIKEPLSIYTYPSIYYLAYVRYMDKEFDAAFELFRRAAGDSRFRVMSTYYCVESRFMQGDNAYVAEVGPTIIDEVGADLKPNLARIVAEALFSLNRNEEASHYLEVYRNSGAKLSRKDYYFSGILSYDLKSYKAAAESFEKVVTAPDSLSQNAWYHLANCYLNQRNQIAAMTAFQSAATLDFDPAIQEDALFNFAKLSFDVNADISQFDQYMQRYPKSGRDDIINNYIAASYLRAKDYGSAVEALGKVVKKDPETVVNLQRASYLRAMQHIQAGAYRSAIPMLETSLANAKYDPALGNQASYWMAECFYRNSRFQDAANIYTQLIDRPDFRRTEQGSLSLYNLAYCHFKAGKFPDAQKRFAEFLETQEAQLFDRDARIRLGDSYYMQNNYAAAAAAYEAVYTKYNTSSDIYPAYQSAVAYGLTGNDAKKIAILRSVIRRHRNATLYPQALFELGRTYVQRGENEDASECFYTLLGMKTDSSYYAKSLLELAMISSNAGKFDKAIDYYKTVVSECPRTQEAQDAISGMESIYQTLNKPEVFLSWLDEIGMSNIKSEDEREQMLFASAEQLHQNGRHTSAMSALQSFLATYPDGPYTTRAWFLLGESLRATNRKEAATDAYLKVMKRGDNPAVTEAANVAYAKISMELERYSRAAAAYSALIANTGNDNLRQTARLGRMRAYFRSRKYDDAIKDGQMLLSDETLPAAVSREVRYTLAKSYRVKGDRMQAKPLLEALASDASDAYGAEANYLQVLDAFQAGDFVEVENRVYAFSDSGTSQLYWLAKSFIILGDAFAAREDMEQAEATWRSVLDGYAPGADDDDVLDPVRDRIEKLINQEVKG